ncbi:MAG: hypothetical protein MUF05_02550 [Candidatus Omnitrophica bacterium]|jgi:hypothetical protein|nr:hypothetical protein [Candidatus Omnitrophota bacterium]
MQIKPIKIIFALLTLAVIAGLGLFLWHYFNSTIPQMVENISAKQQAINTLRERQARIDEAIERTVKQIEKRMEQKPEERPAFMPKMQIQNEIIAFENSLASVEKPALEALSRQNEAISLWGQKRLETKEAYLMLKQAIGQCEKITQDIKFISISADLPAQISEALKNAKYNLIQSYNQKLLALEQRLELLGTNDKNCEYKYQQIIKQSRQFAAESALNIIEAKEASGIDVLSQTLLAQQDKPRAPCRIDAIFYSQVSPFVFIDRIIYHINDQTCAGTITQIKPDCVVMRFGNVDMQYRVGENIQ